MVAILSYESDLIFEHEHNDAVSSPDDITKV
jgi:hypothetical protein